MNQLRMLAQTHLCLPHSFISQIGAERLRLLCWGLGHPTFCGKWCNRCAAKFTRNSVVIRYRAQVNRGRSLLTISSIIVQLAERQWIWKSFFHSKQFNKKWWNCTFLRLARGLSSLGFVTLTAEVGEKSFLNAIQSLIIFIFHSIKRKCTKTEKRRSFYNNNKSID